MRVGIFAGTFDPVHMGHIAFAEAAVKKGGLSKVIFMPEPRPSYKHNVTDIVHREAMLRLICQKRAHLDVLVLDDQSFSVPVTLPKIQHHVKGKLFFMFGADVAASIKSWPGYDILARHVSFIIGERRGQKSPDIPGALFVATNFADAASTDIRQGNSAQLPPEVTEYIAGHNLYNT
jgi:nicotinate-nucleotide adenylyltransferase